MSQDPQALDQDPEYPNAEMALEALPAEEGEKNEVARIVPAWLLSFAAHATIGLVFSMVAFSQVDKGGIELPPMVINKIDPPREEPKEPKTLPRTLEDKNQTFVIESEVEAPVTLVTVDTKIEPEIASEEPPLGREEALATSELGNTGFFMAIGPGGNSAGLYGSRFGNGKRRALRSGGTKSSENAVDAALRWFKKHQSANGMWDSVNYNQNCPEEGKCEKGGSSDGDANIAVTSYALLCYLGAGYDHLSPTKYRTTVENGVRWLKEKQQANGLFGARNYEHAVATMALAEAYAITKDGELRGPAQRAVDYLLEKQNPNSGNSGSGASGLGWDYTNPTGRNDSSVTGWCVMALKSAMAGDLNVKGGLEGAREWLKQTYEISNPNHATLDPYSGLANFTYSWDSKDRKAHANNDRVSMGSLCAVFLGHKAGDKMLATLLNTVTQNQVPTSYPCNTYWMYYNTTAAFQAFDMEDARWKKWNGTVRDMLIKAQRRDACFDGSWDWEGTGFHGANVGRTLSTAYCCLSLEVYYRYNKELTLIK